MPQADGSAKEQRLDVIIATQRNRRLHFFDASSLEPLGSFVVHHLAHTVSASPDGRTLYVQQALTPDGNGCCALLAIDLLTKRMCPMVEPSNLAVPTPDGQTVFTQRGAVGIEVFDARTLARMPIIEAPGNYHLHPSQDSRWLFGTTSWQGPSLDIIDIKEGALVQRLSIPQKAWPSGTWLGDKFYLHARENGQSRLWVAAAHAKALEAPYQLDLPDLMETRGPGLLQLIAGGNRLFLFEIFGHKLDRRRGGKKDLPGGVFLIDPDSRKLISHLAPEIHFSRLVVSSDGRTVYGIDSGQLDWNGPVRLLKLDVEGKVLVEQILETDVWFLAWASVPESLIPRGEVGTIPCSAQSGR